MIFLKIYERHDSMQNKIHEMKKVILHIHLDGSVRPETIQKWLNEDGNFFELEDIKSRLMVQSDCTDLNNYLEKFNLPSQLLQTEQHLEQATYELFEDLFKQNVIYAEVRFAPSKHLEKGLSYENVIEAAINGMNKAKEKFGIGGNLILCCMRGENNESENIQTVNMAEKYLNNGVCGLDLAGAEAIFPTKNFSNIFKLANGYQIPFTIHAGEADGYESISTAIVFGAKRIGHGVRCIENEVLMKEIKDSKIALEICPTSNMQTHAINGEYPLERLYKYNIHTTINTDNDTVSNTNIEKEYNWVLNNTNLTYNDLLKMNMYAIGAAFITEEERKEFLGKLI